MGGDGPLGPVCLWSVSLAKLRLWVQLLVLASAGSAGLVQAGQGCRATGCTGTHRHAQDTQGRTGMHRDTQGCTRTHRDAQGRTRMHRSAQGHTVMHRDAHPAAVPAAQKPCSPERDHSQGQAPLRKAGTPSAMLLPPVRVGGCDCH